MLLDIDFTQLKNDLRIRKNGNILEIYDPVRRKYLVLQPEEMVRQLVVQYLRTIKDYPLSKIRVEMGLTVNELMKRCDILLYDTHFKPFMLVECKSAKIPIDQAVFDQIARYNLKFKVPYLMVTNGLATYCCQIDHLKEGYHFLSEIPNFTSAL
jgi:Type I restriction enzyme R protein N terminus (HSDR_N)